MSGKPAPTKQGTTPLSGDQVAAHLQAHPDFLARHPELWSALPPPRRALGNGVADLQSTMIERLRADVRRLEDKAGDLTRQARDHRSFAAQIHKAVLALVAAQDFALLIEVVTTDLAALLGVDVALLAVEAETRACARHDVAGVRCVPPGSIVAAMGGDAEVALVADATADPQVFGSTAGLVRSWAMARLGAGRGLPPALLALGTRTPDRFQPGRGADSLRSLAHVLEHCLRSRLNLPT